MTQSGDQLGSGMGRGRSDAGDQAGRPRRDYHDWGHIGDTREHLRRFLPGYQARLHAFGAIPIDASQPLDQVVDAIRSHKLASATASRAG